ncbi:retrovirus-related pol polyprotein from transposon TNT 1-94 [Tanacetum coccineum]
MAAFSPVCLMFKASLTKSWLWHRRLSYLNFGTINDLNKHDLVDGLLKFNYGKDHLCSSCERGKSKKDSHPPKLVPSSHSMLELLHMDLCGPMRVDSINGKRSLPICLSILLHNKFNQEDSSATSSIDIEAHEAPPIVTTSEEQNYTISLTVADEFYQEDSAKLDGNTLLTLYDAPDFSEAKSSTNLDPSNMHDTIKPKNIKEDMPDYSWIESMQDELHQFKRLDVWELVPRPAGKNIIVEEGIDFEESFALFARLEAVRIFVAYATHKTSQSFRWVLKKALYGLKQASRAWYDKLSSFIIEHHFTKDFSKQFANLMKNKFEISMMGELKFSFGLQVQQSPRGIFISQSQYAIELLKKHGLMYLTASCPDIAFATIVCARYQARPTVKHLKEDSGFELIAYSDADHAGCKDDCKSTSGGIQFLGEKLVS